MLLNVGIDMTLGTVDINRCHWILDALDELRIKKENYKVLGENFGKEDLVKKVKINNEKVTKMLFFRML